MAAANHINEQKVVRTTETFVFNLTNGAIANGDEVKAVRQVSVSKCNEMIVRQITVSGTENPGNITFICCNLVRENQGIIGTFSGAAESSVSPNSTFMVGKSLSGLTFSFKEFDALDASQPPTPTSTIAQVAVTIEFRSYL